MNSAKPLDVLWRTISLKYALTPAQKVGIEMFELDAPALNDIAKVDRETGAYAFTVAETRTPNVPVGVC